MNNPSLTKEELKREKSREHLLELFDELKARKPRITQARSIMSNICQEYCMEPSHSRRKLH